MQIVPGSEIHGIRTVKVRDILGWSLCTGGSDRGLYTSRLNKHIGDLENPPTTEKLMSELAKLGYVRDAVDDDCDHALDYGKFQWALTDLGRRFLVAKATRPISRKKADGMLANLLDRARQINLNDKYLCRVEKLAVFGSYLKDDVESLGDLDIFYSVVNRTFGEEYANARDRRAKDEGMHFRSFMEQIGWPETEVMAILKGKTRGLSLHHWGELDAMETPFRIVFDNWQSSDDGES